MSVDIDAKRQALDALDNLRRVGDGANGNGGPAGESTNDEEIETIVEVADDSRHSHVTVWFCADRRQPLSY